VNTCWCVGVPVSTVVRRDERAGRGGKHSREVRADVAGIAKVQRADGRCLSAAPTPFSFRLSVFRTVNVVARVGRPPRSVTVVVVAGFGGVGRRVEMNRTNE